MLSRLIQSSIGCDPELFLKRDEDGSIVGSEKIIPPDGLKVQEAYNSSSKIIRDGVQIELNPAAAPNTPGLGANITKCFAELALTLRKTPGISLCYDGLVEVKRDELDSLSPGSRELGCQPSSNVYGDRPITVDTKRYRKRSAGGHPHFGIYIYSKLFEERRSIVPLCDMFLGNTCVLIDRDPGAAERRENYGRAGEYRLQPHGLEYRTLSNFWLRDPVLMDLVFGMGSVALSIISQGLDGNDIEPELIQSVDIHKFIKAIDTNSWDLAMENFQTLRPFIVKHFPVGAFPIDANNIDKFEVFARGVKEKGLTHFFPKDPMTTWLAAKYTPVRQFIDTIH